MRICEHAGFRWVGLDYKSAAAPILGDAHALTFPDGSIESVLIEFVLSIAVRGPLQFRLVATKEVMRVLEPGGLYIGTVAFLEPSHQSSYYHPSSYYHHTSLGTYNTLKSAGSSSKELRQARAGLVCERRQSWRGGLFPYLPARIRRALVSPLGLLDRAWRWVEGKVNPTATPRNRIVSFTGAFGFVARTPGSPG